MINTILFNHMDLACTRKTGLDYLNEYIISKGIKKSDIITVSSNGNGYTLIYHEQELCDSVHYDNSCEACRDEYTLTQPDTVIGYFKTAVANYICPRHSKGVSKMKHTINELLELQDKNISWMINTCSFTINFMKECLLAIERSHDKDVVSDMRLIYNRRLAQIPRFPPY